ncbi:hypothetical protein HAX54_000600 [Datura stramonium]|uniref:Uncharacterized protein n=1 Tax=Datura stramonium TaxID=4076 RepID=A0ABS8WSB0_DATST|nr:hypothetical protein [Datura stramonium]
MIEMQWKFGLRLPKCGSRIRMTSERTPRPCTTKQSDPTNKDATEYLARLENSQMIIIPGFASTIATGFGDLRVYELRVLVLGRPYAALKANMRKVMSDVQRLQPDLRIFDAPLPKNRNFKG